VLEARDTVRVSQDLVPNLGRVVGVPELETGARERARVVWSAVAVFLYTLFTWTAAPNSSRLCRGGRINTIADPSPNDTYPESL
jgi:hypothetical protein